MLTADLNAAREEFRRMAAAYEGECEASRTALIAIGAAGTIDETRLAAIRPLPHDPRPC